MTKNISTNRITKLYVCSFIILSCCAFNSTFAAHVTSFAFKSEFAIRDSKYHIDQLISFLLSLNQEFLFL